MKFLFSLILFLSSSLCAFANVGLPTFDFSNLVSSIESVSNALKFYEKTINSLQEYTIKLSKLGENISPEKLLSLIKNFDLSEKSRKELINMVNKVIDDFDTANSDFGLFMKGIEENINDELGIETNSSIQQSIKKMRTTINTSSLKNTINKKYEEAEKKLKELEEKKNALIEEYNNKKKDFENTISTLENELNSLTSTSSDSAVALSEINIKTATLNNLKLNLQTTDAEMNRKIDEINKTIESNQKEVNRLKTSLLNLAKSIDNLKNIKSAVTQKENSNKAYKEKIRFEF